MIKKSFKKTEKYFTEGTREQFQLHKFLFFSNLLLFIFMIFEIYHGFDSQKIPHFIHVLEFIFGLLFLVELILYLIHVYIPNKVFFKPRIIINALVVISLLAPTLFGNLAFLRLIKSIKIIKVFIYRRKMKKDLKRNPEFKRKKTS